MSVLNHLKLKSALPVSWLLAAGADGGLGVMADADPVRRAAHL